MIASCLARPSNSTTRIVNIYFAAAVLNNAISYVPEGAPEYFASVEAHTSSRKTERYESQCKIINA